MIKKICPFHSEEPIKYLLKKAPKQNRFKSVLSIGKDYLSRIGFKSLKHAWIIGTTKDIAKVLQASWRKEDLISKFSTLKGTVYITANPKIMKVIFQNPRSQEDGLFKDVENTKLFINTMLSDLYPDDIKKLNTDEVISKVIFTAFQEKVKCLRSPLMEVLGAAMVKEYEPQMEDIANTIFTALSEEEKNLCNGENLAFEFAITVISKLITGYQGQRSNYIALANALNLFGKRMTYSLLHQPLNKKEKIEYQKAILIVREVIQKNLDSKNPSNFILKMRGSGFDEFEMKAMLFFIYFAGTETTASSVNYLIWQLAKPEHSAFLEKLRDPEQKEGFLSQLIAETLRLHPASFIQGRQLHKDTLLEEYGANGKLLRKMRLQGKKALVCLTQVAALDESQFSKSHEFNPDNFKAEDARSQLFWHPFGAGPHVCPGQYLALAELKTFISCLVSKFNLQLLENKYQPEQKGMFTLRATPAKIKLMPIITGFSNH